MSNRYKVTDDAIPGYLQEIEIQHDVRIIFACEAGSRAWGYSVEESDYDVRFIYARRTDWYLALFGPAADTMTLRPQGNVELVGWDIQKVLRLAAKANPAALEWFRSPIEYSYLRYAIARHAPNIKKAVDSHFCPVAAWYHHHRMARWVWAKKLQERPSPKAQLQCLREILSRDHVTRTCTPSPGVLPKLIAGCDAPAGLEVKMVELLQRKDVCPEVGDFLECRLAYLDRPLEKKTKDTSDLNALFLEVVR